MKKKIIIIIFLSLILLAACSRRTESSYPAKQKSYINVSNQITKLDNSMSVAQIKGNDNFDDFYKNGGASSDAEVISYLKNKLLKSPALGSINFKSIPFACSTLATNSYFGRNFDWQHSNSLILLDYPSKGYSSISTVSLSFITQATNSHLSDNLLKRIAVFAPLDGMNEKGVAISVNMLDDNHTINQDEKNKINLTTTTAIRAILNRASSTAEALKILKATNLHASEKLNIHFAISDRNHHSVVVEYIDNQLHVTETPIVTNFYLTPGKYYGQGSEQSIRRFKILAKKLKNNPIMNEKQVSDSLKAVSKHNFANDGETTEWSVIYNLKKLEATYYHRENFKHSYKIKLNEK